MKNGNVRLTVLLGISVLLYLGITLCDLSIGDYYGDEAGSRFSITLKSRSQISNGISFDKCKDFSRQYDQGQVGFYSSEEALVESDYGREVAEVYGSNNNFLEFNGFRLINGSFISEGDIENKENYIAISEKLALEMFKTLDVIGKDIMVYEEPFTVIGVFETSTNPVMNLLNKDEKLLIMPYAKFEELRPGNRAVHLEGQYGSEITKSEIMNWFEDNNINFSHYNYRNISHRQVVFKKNVQILLFLLGITLILELIYLLKQQGISFFNHTRGAIKEHYLFDWLKKDIRKIVFEFIRTSSLVFAIALIWRWITFDFYLGIYYDGSYLIENLGDFLKWVINTNFIEDLLYNSPSFSAITWIDKIRNIGLVLLVLPCVLLYKEIRQVVKTVKLPRLLKGIQKHPKMRNSNKTITDNVSDEIG